MTKISFSVYELHTPVLLDEAVSAIVGKSNKTHIYIDATVWLGGHSQEILARMSANDTLCVVDRDSENLGQAVALLEKSEVDRIGRSRILPIHASFADVDTFLSQSGIDTIDGVLYDLGVSSVHYDDTERGFSIRGDGPLDMRFDRFDTTRKTASEVLAEIDEKELCQSLRDYADEPKAYFIAKAIVEKRKTETIDTTGKLSALIDAASFDPKSKSRVFQAIRILVNEEFKQIEISIPKMIERLSPGGRLAVITFHSIEDRLVKNICKVFETPKAHPITGQITAHAVIRKVYKKPIEASEEETRVNPRSRSAKLRIYEKI